MHGMWTIRWQGLAAGLGLMVSVAAAAGCGRGDAGAAAAEVATPAIEIGRENVVTVATGDISVGPLISGELRAQREATVRAELGGSVLSVSAEEGQPIKQGALLARIDSRTQQDAYQSAQSMVHSAEEALALAERELARTERLVKAGALAERDLESAKNTATSLRAQRDDAKTRAVSAQKSLDDATVHAPISGLVARKRVNAGDVVSLGTELYTIIDPSSMRLEASVSSEQLGDVHIGAPVTFDVRGYPGQHFEGKVERLGAVADPVTRQVPIFVTIPNAGGRLLSGLFAEGRVLREARRALVVPVTAVNLRGDPWVLRVRDGKAERVAVTIGLHDEQTERVELLSGVKEGDVLLLGAAQGMTPGTPVRFRERQAAEE
jgi:membrane fusion protein, multidrug efflux system